MNLEIISLALSFLVILLSICLVCTTKRKAEFEKLAKDYKYNFELIRSKASKVNFMTASKYNLVPLMLRKEIFNKNISEATDGEIISSIVDEFMETHKETLRDFVLLKFEENPVKEVIDVEATLLVGKYREED